MCCNIPVQMSQPFKKMNVHAGRIVTQEIWILTLPIMNISLQVGTSKKKKISEISYPYTESAMSEG